jgi:outer membrane lipoprotein-sorting protein
MQRRSLLIAGLASLALVSAAPAWALSAQDRADVLRIQTYLNDIHTLKAHFVQIAPDGATTQGTAWLWRPGRMRFQYDKPSPLLLVAGHGQVVFRDNQLDQTSTIPLSNTPLGILLAEHVDLTGGSVLVQSLQHLPGEIEITLARAAHPAEGQLTLTLAETPLQLKAWVVTDAQRNQTRVSLLDIDTGAGGFDPSLFEYKDPNLAAPPGGNG